MDTSYVAPKLSGARPPAFPRESRILPTLAVGTGAQVLEFGTTQPYRLYIVRSFSSCKLSVTNIRNISTWSGIS